jgi:hypothetical protein
VPCGDSSAIAATTVATASQPSTSSPAIPASSATPSSTSGAGRWTAAQAPAVADLTMIVATAHAITDRRKPLLAALEHRSALFMALNLV